MNGIQNDLNKLDKEYDNSSDQSSFIMQKNRSTAYGYWKTIGYMKDYIGQLLELITNCIYHHDEED